MKNPILYVVTYSPETTTASTTENALATLPAAMDR